MERSDEGVGGYSGSICSLIILDLRKNVIIKELEDTSYNNSTIINDWIDINKLQYCYSDGITTSDFMVFNIINSDNSNGYDNTESNNHIFEGIASSNSKIITWVEFNNISKSTSVQDKFF